MGSLAPSACGTLSPLHLAKVSTGPEAPKADLFREAGRQRKGLGELRVKAEASRGLRRAGPRCEVKAGYWQIRMLSSGAEPRPAERQGQLPPTQPG